MATSILISPTAATSAIAILATFFTLRSMPRELGRWREPLTGRVAGAKNGVLATHDWKEAALLVGETKHFEAERVLMFRVLEEMDGGTRKEK